MESVMTDYQLRTLLQMILMILEKCETLEEAIGKIGQLTAEDENVD